MDLARNRESSVLTRRFVTHALISCGTDPLVHYGRHFGRTVHALCTVHALLTNGIIRMGELADEPEDTFTHESVADFYCL